jgi:hypothetical protein
MTSVGERAKLEKELYSPVSELFTARGWHVWEQATIRAGDVGTMTADHVAWKWDGDEIEGIAVEVKPGPADVGLAQAVAYGVGFDHVYVAAEEPLSQTGYVRRVFERLGLGYIHVTPSTARIELEPETSSYRADSVRDENVGRIKLKHLFTEEVVGEPVTFGRDKRGDIWAVTGNTSAWQICGQVVSQSSCAWLSLLAESKWLGDRIAFRVQPADLAAAIDEFEESAPTLFLRRREHKGYQPKYSEPLEVWQPGDGVARLGELLEAARGLSAPKVGPHFEVRIEHWPHGARLTEIDAVGELRATIGNLRAVRDRLNELTLT